MEAKCFNDLVKEWNALYEVNNKKLEELNNCKKEAAKEIINKMNEIDSLLNNLLKDIDTKKEQVK